MREYTQSERPAIELFQKLGYDYLDAKKQKESGDADATSLSA